MGETSGTGPSADEATWDRGRVRKLRRYLDDTQAAFAERLGTRQQTVSEWERGASHPRRMARRLLQLVAESEGFYVVPRSVVSGSVVSGGTASSGAAPGSIVPGDAVPGGVLPGEAAPGIVMPASVAPDGASPDGAPPVERVEAGEPVASKGDGSEGAAAELEEGEFEEAGDGAQRETRTDQRDGP